ncbi:APC family permease [Paraclostridium sordellii]|uniref:Amino acid/polyamine transporter n=1 Tax=Paraclostridium sordellii TaxID=1505 RepID=A0A0C7P1L8_PARSO|nr:amino acid permease [Paeniclostridium sordellii]QYE98534.1 amino acid permease [Paeniclostridium sordellii]CEN79610.1 amino acid/polyamine transporter [[Clostridium] sordellii] [Paeniclostridium sordellii]CEO05532.1 amino acid/polyamine transporter [[Clostridium] sordellii] [Paeniclostridium sordellii]CEP79438.1 amino acid/polyamine transporter [[Clostridium] sordellii] [Paeniclostridium sordellii]CEP86097.1 amino acid/polyamine transporter [[Clostridium] sordellii] [Paeniclostridium sordel
MSNKGLQKTLGLSAALSTVVGMVIGAGVFFKPQAIYQATGGAPGLGMLAWIIAGFITIAAGLTAAEVSAAIPKTGGMMIYIQEIYGERLGFLTGWMQTVLFFPATAAALGVIFAQQAATLIGQSEKNMVVVLPIAIGIILFLAILNTVGSKLGGTIQTVATICKLIPLGVIMVFGFINGSGDNSITTPLVAQNLSVGTVLGQVLIAALFAYDGWINVGAIAGEMKNPGKDLPKAIVGGLSIVMAVYVIINLAYLWVVPASEMAQHSAPAAVVAKEMFGPIGGKLVTVGILISVFGGLNGYLLTGPRISYALACEGIFPFSKKLSKLNRGGVPANSTLLMAILACIYALSGKFNDLTDLTIFIIWVFYVLTFIGVMKLRKDQPNLERPYRVPLYPIIPLIAIAGGLFVIVNQLMSNTFLAGGGLLVTAIGLPVYSVMSKKNNN